MRTAQCKAKGRRLQVALADALSARFALRIEAVRPTLPGTRANGAVYTDEGDADLRVRRMGETGVDVALLSSVARARIAIAGRACAFECKNVEALTVGNADFWRTGALGGVVAAAGQQLMATLHPATQTPVIVVSRNRWPVLVVWRCGARVPSAYFTNGRVYVAELHVWMEVLDGA